MTADQRAVRHATGPLVFSRAAPAYNRVGPRPFAHFARRIAALAGVTRGARVLDVATGTGAILLAAAERTGEEGILVGVDLSEEMLARAAEEVRDRGLSNVDLHAMDAQRLDFADESFDYAFCGFALSSLPRAEDALAGIARTLRTGGKFGLIEAPSWFFLHHPRWAPQGDVFRSFGVAVGDYEPDRERARLVEGLRRAGLRDILVSEERYQLRFSDEEEWWAWMWSHGTRSLLEAVPGEERDALRRALVLELARCRDDDGVIHGELAAHLLVAEKPHPNEGRAPASS